MESQAKKKKMAECVGPERRDIIGVEKKIRRAWHHWVWGSTCFSTEGCEVVVSQGCEVVRWNDYEDVDERCGK